MQMAFWTSPRLSSVPVLNTLTHCSLLAAHVSAFKAQSSFLCFKPDHREEQLKIMAGAVVKKKISRLMKRKSCPLQSKINGEYICCFGLETTITLQLSKQVLVEYV